MSESTNNYEQRVASQIAQYANVDDMHVRSSFQDWLNKSINEPRLYSVFGASHLSEIYAIHLSKAVERTGIDRVVSLGAGYGALEVSIMAWVRDHGLTPFRMVCTDLSPILVERAQRAIDGEGLSHCMSARIADLNGPFDIEGPVAAVMVHHALHHFVELEHIFAQIDGLLHPEGTFMTQDMIGRNGHMRWPEALGLVKELWQCVPERYRYNHMHGKLSRYYENWDCSIEGFEGIRAQDILPLLLRRFRFERFFTNLIISDVFIGPAFGPNFHSDDPNDLEFINQLQKLEDTAIDIGVLKPVQMFAVMRPLRSSTCPARPLVWNGRTPERCLRLPDAMLQHLPTLAQFGFQNPYAAEVTLPALALIESREDVSFGVDGPGTTLTRSGWYDPETDFTWAWGIESDIEFQAADTVGAIHIRLIPYPVPNQEKRVLDIFLNEERIGSVDILGEGVLTQWLTLPQPLDGRERAHLRFVCSRPRRPDLDSGDDMRPLSFALLSIRLEPVVA